MKDEKQNRLNRIEEYCKAHGVVGKSYNAVMSMLNEKRELEFGDKNSQKMLSEMGMCISHVEKVYAKDIENGSLGRYSSILDAALNINYRPEAIFNMLGSFNPKHPSVKEKMVFYEDKGKNFLYDDGNHRLIAFLIEYAVALAGAKSPKEIEEINNKYVLETRVKHYPNCKELFDKIKQKATTCYERNLSKQTRAYFEKMLEAEVPFSGAYVDYDKTHDTYKVSIGGYVKENMTKEEACDFVSSIPKNKNEVMAWEYGGEYFVARDSVVVRTKDEGTFKNALKVANQEYDANEIPAYSDDCMIEILDNGQYNLYIQSFYFYLFELSFGKHPQLDEKIKELKAFYNKNAESYRDGIKNDGFIMTDNSAIYTIYERTYRNIDEKRLTQLLGDLQTEHQIREELVQLVKQEETMM